MHNEPCKGIFTVPHIQDLVFQHNFTTSELALLREVSRSWCAMVEPFLWSNFTFEDGFRGREAAKETLIKNAKWIHHLSLRDIDVLQWLSESQSCNRLTSLCIALPSYARKNQALVVVDLIQQNCQQLKTFEWVSNGWFDDTSSPPALVTIMTEGLMGISRFGHLREVVMDDARLDLDILGELLAICKQIEILRVRHCLCQGSIAETQLLAPSLNNLTTVTWERNIGNHIQGLCMILRASDGLLELNLGGDPMTSDDLTELSTIENLGRLDTLTIDGASYHDQDLAQILNLTCTLSTLNLTCLERWDGDADKWIAKTVCESQLKDTLVTFRLSMVDISSMDQLLILMTCAHLKVFQVQQYWNHSPTILIHQLQQPLLHSQHQEHKLVNSISPSDSSGMDFCEWKCVGLEDLELGFAFDQPVTQSRSGIVVPHSDLYEKLGHVQMISGLGKLFDQLARLTRLKKLRIDFRESAEMNLGNEEACLWKDDMVILWKKLKPCTNLQSLLVHWSLPYETGKQIENWSKDTWPRAKVAVGSYVRKLY